MLRTGFKFYVYNSAFGWSSFGFEELQHVLSAVTALKHDCQTFSYKNLAGLGVFFKRKRRILSRELTTNPALKTPGEIKRQVLRSECFAFRSEFLEG